MAFLDDVLKGWGPSVLIGAGVVLAAPLLLPATTSVVRPLAKALVKGYFAAAEKMKEVMAEVGEQVSDLVAEAKAEYEAGAATTAGEQHPSTLSQA